MRVVLVHNSGGTVEFFTPKVYIALYFFVEKPTKKGNDNNAVDGT